MALALAGDVTQSQPLAADLDKRYPEDTSVQTSYLPTLRALFALHAGQPSQAIEQLQPARPYEFADPAINFLAYFGGFYPVYVRGEAYLAANQGAEAAAEFQKILDHRGLVLGDPMGAARVWNSAERGRWREMRRRRRPRTRISSRSGKTPTPTSRFSRRRRQSTPSCSKFRIWLHVILTWFEDSKARVHGKSQPVRAKRRSGFDTGS